ncbi:hypothetical protein [Allocoleopsis franciscana]|uniref:Uncharacterized protein n=1 Tax=Allocoleopsis franciscana PCC 7113 TaxID=1173027 RepID=K9W9S2_9CYAN|nr:hypothetical protein [Allocoleopsis franciscana]AFZ16524.1 hypothetical protein Mic7113_0610 [Allocoleopsis franciscana PCC 7113]
MTQNNTGKFSFTGFGLVGLLALIVLGGGALLLNQNSPTFSVEGGKVGDVKGGEGGKGGDSSTTNIYGSGTNQKGDGNQSSSLSASQETSPATNQSSQANNSAQNVNDTANNVVWTLTYPVYRLEQDKCSLKGKDSVNITQTQGSLYFGGGTNGYGDTSIRGTITPNGQVNLSLSGNKGGIDFVTFEGANPTNSQNLNATVITGKVTTPNCPNDTFQLSKGN